MAPTAQATTRGYANLWDHADLTRPTDAGAQADAILKNKTRYEAVAAKFGMPWQFIACAHTRESNRNFNAHLHNGDSLAHRTHQVPPGRPKEPPANGVSYTWEESAEDALRMRGLQNVKGWTVEVFLFEEEAYNGWGYLGHGNSPYIWCWTSQYYGGKYVADHVYDPNAWDKQPGCAALLKALAERDDSTRSFCMRRGGSVVPQDLPARHTKNERATAGAGAATGTAGVGTEVGTTKPADPGSAVGHSMLTYGLMGVGLVIVVFAVLLMLRKNSIIRSKFEGGTVLPPPAETPRPPELEPEIVPPAPPAASDPTIKPEVAAAVIAGEGKGKS